MRLTGHFIDNWRERVGHAPTEEEIQAIIRESLVVQRFSSFRLLCGGKYRRLALYWHPARNVIVSYDAESDTAVSVLSRKMWEEKHVTADACA